MAVQPLNGVRNTIDGIRPESLEIAYSIRNATKSVIPNLGLGFGSPTAWDGVKSGDSPSLTHINDPAGSEGKVIHSPGTSSGEFIRISDAAGTIFPQGTVMIRAHVDVAIAKAHLVNSSTNIGTAGGFVIRMNRNTQNIDFYLTDINDKLEDKQYSWNPTSGDLATDPPATMIVRWGPNNSFKPMVNGDDTPDNIAVDDAVSSGWKIQPAASSSSGEYRLLAFYLTNRPTADLYTFYHWSVELTDAEMLALTADPYLPLRQRVKSTLPLGTRGTQLNTDSIAGATKTQWDITGDATFTHTTTATSGAFGSVLSSNLSHVNMWLPPFHNYLARVRQYVNGSWGEWTPFINFASRGPVNSFENYSILNSGTVTIP